MQTIPLILASASPRRKLLLEQIGISFEIHPSQVAEPEYPGGDPVKYALSLAELKAADISNIYPHALVVGADTIVVVDDAVLGKPVDPTSAENMLKLLSNRTHQVVTAYSIQHRFLDIQLDRHVSTQVRFKPLAEDEIKRYIKSGAPFDKAGAYGIQDYSGVFVDRIEGCFYNVVGFPLSDFHTALKELLTKHQLTIYPG
ncbi:MAG: Maf family protein [Candidatus Marinimicrobia bacterium]|nr:Maf family protein [Candidatus Neomarinimicrobiota bacterium]